jgi:tetratricopeptide (TPR) repeat protein
MARYLWLTLWPAKLSCDYSYNQIPLAHGAAEDWFAYAVVLASAMIVLLLYRWNRTCFFLACFAFLNFLPASNLFFPIGTIMAERLLYLPSLGLLGCLVLAVYAGVNRRGVAIAAPVILGLITAGFAVRTWIRNQDWQTDLTLATNDVRVSPNSFKLHRLLAASLFESDRAHSNIDQVVAEQEKAVAILNPLPDGQIPQDVYRQAGYYYLLEGDRAHQNRAAYESARQALLRCISIGKIWREKYRARPDGDAQANFLLSVVYLRLGNLDQSYLAADQARTLDPLNPQVYRQLAEIFSLQHRVEDSNTATFEDYAITSLQQGKWQEAAALSDRVLEKHATDYPSAYYLNAMANLRLGKLVVAEKSAREAIRLDSARRNPRTSYVLGLILAQKHEFKEAVASLNSYLNEAPEAPDAETVRKQLREIEKLAPN